jgi:glycosyltransferase involved in cell wall biosynthesis
VTILTRPLSTGSAERRRLRVVLVLKTAEGGLWVLPHIDALRRRGHQVSVVLPAGPGRLRTALTGARVPVVDSAFGFSFRPAPATLRGLWRLRRQLAALTPDVVHYHLYASALAARLATLAQPVARVHMVAGPLYLDSRLIRWCERLLARLDHVTIGGSEHTALRYRALGLSAARTPAIPYGVDTTEFSPAGPAARAAARHRLGLAPETFVAIMVAYVYAPKRRLHAGVGIKGHHTLLAAWQRFHAEHPDSHLILLGAGFDAAGEAYRQRLLADATLSGVRWLASAADVRGYYAAADVSVSPSLSENHGAAVEASAMGVPCIVSDAGALPETVDARSGWVVPRGAVAPLLAALAEAYAEHRAGTLAERGWYARQLMLAGFDRRDAAVRVAQTIERAAAGIPTDHSTVDRMGGRW